MGNGPLRKALKAYCFLTARTNDLWTSSFFIEFYCAKLTEFYPLKSIDISRYAQTLTLMKHTMALLAMFLLTNLTNVCSRINIPLAIRFLTMQNWLLCFHFNWWFQLECFPFWMGILWEIAKHGLIYINWCLAK